ncbi:MAG: hypothetical protein FWF44_02160 [Defluviitaleaceae bacterium]|nr:hypothetical protein [Defluviitaleaceae bacterium]
MALAHWLYTANEKAYESEIITKPMYEYARDELCKSVSAAEKRYDIPSGEAGDAIGLIENPPSAG